jgi:hypothetical protein
LKSLPRTAWARVVAAELFDQLLFAAAHEAQAALNARFAREALTPFRGWLESRAGRRDRRCVSWSPPVRMLQPERCAGQLAELAQSTTLSETF